MQILKVETENKQTDNDKIEGYHADIDEMAAQLKCGKTVLEVADEYVSLEDPQSPEEIVNKVGELKLGVNKILGTLVDDLTNQSQLLIHTKKELETAKKELEEIYKVKQTASTLQNLLNLHQEKKAELEKNFEDLEIYFETKQTQKTKVQKEQEEFLNLNRKREHEEFEYNHKQSRKKEEDDYETKKILKIEELETREKELTDSENELDNLRKLTLSFDSKLGDAIMDASNKAIESTQKDLEIKYNLEKKDVEMQN